jgi:hypothetical protein
VTLTLVSAPGDYGNLVFPLTVPTPPGEPIRTLQGASIDQSTDPSGEPSDVFRLAGTEAQLNASLAALFFLPDDATPAYEFVDGQTLYIRILSVPGDDSGNAEPVDVQIRIEGRNEPPDLTVATGPYFRGYPDEVDLPANPSNPPDYADDEAPLFSVVDPDAAHGEFDDRMLLAAFVSCGEFHLRGGTFQIGDALEDLLKLGLNLPDDVADAILAIVPDEIKSLVFGNEPPGDWQTAFAGVGTLAEVNYALSQVSFRGTASDQTCALVTFVTDLGNNGMPLQWVPPQGDPPLDDFEIPIPLFDLGVTLFVVGEGEPLTVKVEQGGAQADPTSTSPIVFDVDFSEDVVGFDARDVSFAGSAAPGELTAAVTGVGSAYQVEVNGMVTPGLVKVSVPAGAATCPCRRLWRTRRPPRRTTRSPGRSPTARIRRTRLVRRIRRTRQGPRTPPRRVPPTRRRPPTSYRRTQA